MNPVSSFRKEGAVIFALPDTHIPGQTTSKGKKSTGYKRNVIFFEMIQSPPQPRLGILIKKIK